MTVRPKSASAPLHSHWNPGFSGPVSWLLKVQCSAVSEDAVSETLHWVPLQLRVEGKGACPFYGHRGGLRGGQYSSRLSCWQSEARPGGSPVP